METGGIPIGKGPGGIGGGPEPLKEVTKLGEADLGDVEKFKFRLTADDAGAELKIKDRGPLDFQPHRIKDFSVVKPKESGLGEKLVNMTKREIEAGRADDKEVMALSKEATTTPKIMELQFKLIEVTAKTTLLSEVSKKFVQGIREPLKNQ